MENELIIVEPVPVQQVPKRPLVTLENMIHEYLQEMKIMGYAEQTHKNLGAALRTFQQWLGTRMLTRENLLEFRHHLDTHPKYHGGYAQLLWVQVQQFINWLVVAGYTRAKLTSGIRPPSKKAGRPQTAIAESHFPRIMEHAKTEVDRWLYTLLWNTGMAIGDASELQWDEVDMDTWTITRVRKKTASHDRPCVIPIPPVGDLADMLRVRATFRESEAGRWPNINGKEYVHPQAYLDVESARAKMRLTWTLKKAGLSERGYTFHSFRRAYITRLAKGGINPFIGCRIVGHKDPKMFLHYSQNDPETIRAEAERALTQAANQ